MSSLPKTLDATYERILIGIEGLGYGQKALTLLQSLAFSSRPLTVEEAVEILAVDHKTRVFSPRMRLLDPQDVLSICSSLISVVHIQQGQALSSTDHNATGK